MAVPDPELVSIRHVDPVSKQTLKTALLTLAVLHAIERVPALRDLILPRRRWWHFRWFRRRA